MERSEIDRLEQVEVDRLDFVASELVGKQQYEPLVSRVLSLAPGRWLSLAELCVGSPAAEKLVEALGATAEVTFVTALGFPMSGYGPGYALILLYAEHLHWHSVSLYNAGRLERTGG